MTTQLCHVLEQPPAVAVASLCFALRACAYLEVLESWVVQCLMGTDPEVQALAADLMISASNVCQQSLPAISASEDESMDCDGIVMHETATRTPCEILLR